MAAVIFPFKEKLAFLLQRMQLGNNPQLLVPLGPTLTSLFSGSPQPMTEHIDLATST